MIEDRARGKILFNEKGPNLILNSESFKRIIDLNPAKNNFDENISIKIY